jgi:hypothetical protein
MIPGRTRALGAALAAMTIATAPALVAQPSGGPVRYVAFAVDLSDTWRADTAVIEIAVDHWSTDTQREQLLTALAEQGPDELLDTLREMPRAGHIRLQGSLGYPLHFTSRTALPDGGERVVLATDRPIAYWEAVNRPRIMDYPFTVVELRLGPDGTGEGKLSLATRITMSRTGRTIELENYDMQPVQLRGVRRDDTR